VNPRTVDRREFFRYGSVAAAVGAALPLLDSLAQAAPASAATADPDQLFAAGWFAAADRGYARELSQDPDNAHALARRGYIALLSNRFGAAEAFLTRALQLAPGDTFSREQLADCYVRQDQFASAVPLLRQTGNAGDTAAAAQYAALTGVPYQLSGPGSTRVPIVSIDPLPMIKASLNGGTPQLFYFDTGAETVSFSQEVADELGLTAVASATGIAGGQQVTSNFGVLESLQIGEIVVRNLPVLWGSAHGPKPPSGPMPVGTVGTVLFYHFLTTLDYQGRGFVLRRKSQAGSQEFQVAAKGKGYSPLPLWLAGGHFPCTLGSLNNFGPRVVSADTGGPGIGIVCPEQVAQEAGIPVGDRHLIPYQGTMAPSISPAKISLGSAVGRHVPGAVSPILPGSGQNGFQIIANFTHEFFKPFAVTFDYVRMNLYVTPTVPDGR
jgi:hypothetical protein